MATIGSILFPIYSYARPISIAWNISTLCYLFAIKYFLKKQLTIPLVEFLNEPEGELFLLLTSVAMTLVHFYLRLLDCPLVIGPMLAVELPVVFNLLPALILFPCAEVCLAIGWEVLPYTK